MAYLSASELKKMRFKFLGKNVKISDKASIYNPGNISIGDNSRIDDFCILSAGSEGIEIGKYVHISCYASLIGKEKILIGDFSAVSVRTSIFSSTDDFSGQFMTNPTIPEKYTNVYHAPVFINKHSIIGSGSVILPGVTLGDGAAIGALSLVNKDVKKFTINAGVPVKKIKNRKMTVLDLEKSFLIKLSSD